MRMDPTHELQRILAANDPNVQNALTFFKVNLTTLQQQFSTLIPAPPLAWSPELYQSSLGHSQLMIQDGQQSHQLPGEPGLQTRISNAGYPMQSFVGENIFAFANSVFEAHAAFAIDWGNTSNGIQSPPGHRDNIMDPNFREIGPTFVQDNVAKSPVGPFAVTEDFGNRFNFGNPWLLGVVYSDANSNAFYDPGEGLGGVTVDAVQVGGLFTASTTSLATGGYEMQLPAGIYTVTYSGGGLAAPIVQTVTIATDNVEVDIAPNLPPPTVQFGAASGQGSEAKTSVKLAVSLSNAFNQPITVSYAVTGGTATGGGVDYFLPSGTLTVLPGQTAQNISLQVINNTLNEPDETVQITLSNPTNGAALGTNTVFTYTIVNDDPLPTVRFQAATASGSEGTTPAILPVVLSAPSGQVVTVNYAVTGGTAKNGVNYNLSSGALTFQPGQTVQNLALPTLDDGINAPAQTVQITLSGPSNATLGSIPAETYSILNLDPLPSVAFNVTTSSGDESIATPSLLVSLSGPSGRTVTVNYAVVGGTATRNTDYQLPAGTLTFAPGVTSLPIPLFTVSDDSLFESNETIRVALSAPVNATLGNKVVETYTIQDNDTAPTVSFSASNPVTGPKATTLVKLTVTLSAAAGVPVSVDYDVTGGTAVNGGVDFSLPNGTLTFQPGQVSKTIPVTVVNTTRHEPDQTIDVALSNPVNATLGTIAQDTYTIIENSATPLSPPDSRPSVSFNVTTASGDETVTAPSVLVSLSAASTKTVTVNYAVAGGTAVKGVDYKLPAGTLTFAPGVTSLPIPLTVLDDGLFESSETIRLALSAPVNGVLGNKAVETYTILENDPAPTVSFAVASASGSEATTQVSLTVALSGKAGAPVTVDYGVTGGSATNGGVDYKLPNGTLTFQPGQASKTIVLTVNNDTLNEQNESLTVSLFNPVNATLGANPSETYTLVDNDPLPTVGFQLATSSVGRSASTAAVAIGLSAPSGQTVTVSYALDPTSTATAGTNFTLPNSQTVTFLPGQTVQEILITLLDDGLSDANRTIIFDLLSATNALPASGHAVHTLTLTDTVPLPRVNFNVLASSGDRTITTVTIEVDLTAASDQPVTVGYKVVGGTAQGNGVDFTLPPGTVTFQPGQTSQTITLQVVNDTGTDPTETVIIGLSSPLGAILGPGSVFTYSIL
jgi:hypothetical protein